MTAGSKSSSPIPPDAALPRPCSRPTSAGHVVVTSPDAPLIVAESQNGSRHGYRSIIGQGSACEPAGLVTVIEVFCPYESRQPSGSAQPGLSHVSILPLVGSQGGVSFRSRARVRCPYETSRGRMLAGLTNKPSSRMKCSMPPCAEICCSDGSRS